MECMNVLDQFGKMNILDVKTNSLVNTILVTCRKGRVDKSFLHFSSDFQLLET